MTITEKPIFDFDDEFKAIEMSFQKHIVSSKKRPQTKPRDYSETNKGKEFQRSRGTGKTNGRKSEKSANNKKILSTPTQTDLSSHSTSPEKDVPSLNNGSVVNQDKLNKFRSLRKKTGTNGPLGRRGIQSGGRRIRQQRFPPRIPTSKSENGSTSIKPKVKREWCNGRSLSRVEKENLDCSDRASKEAFERSQTEQQQKLVSDDNRRTNVDLEESGSDTDNDFFENDVDDDDEFNENDSFDNEEKEQENTSTGFFGGILSRLSGKIMSSADLNPFIKQMEQTLIGKNVAVDIAKQVCDSVLAELVGTKMGTFTRTKTAVHQAVEESLLRIVTPKQQIDLLHGVAIAREQHRTYSVVFIGVNGVGKSTTLAKVAHYLGTRNLKVSMAACDTFRAGAVEQLQTHARALGIRIYEQGYSKDPSIVCRDAVKESNRLNDDVVLIDTAGRMQDNEPLMRALSKLVIQNNPDLVLFVGEALVGNEAIDQLTKFNRALSDLSTENFPRLIDGIVLSKFDTVDDKVGAAISMTYTTGAPIVFIGTGQTYPDLKRIHAKTLIRQLLK